MITILAFDSKSGTMLPVCSSVFGIPGASPGNVPGQYIAVDKGGRAIMLAAIQCTKVGYAIKIESTAKEMLLEGPLQCEYDEGYQIIYDLVNVDKDAAVPHFAALVAETSEFKADATVNKYITYYKMDISSTASSLARVSSYETDADANKLLNVPGPGDEAGGPGGLLVMSENWICYVKEGADELRAPIPRRSNLDINKGTLITASAVYRYVISLLLLCDVISLTSL
jgi:hypothetical protein